MNSRIDGNGPAPTEQDVVTGTDVLLKALRKAEAEAGGYFFTIGFIGSFVKALKKGSRIYENISDVVEHLEYFLKCLDEQVQIREPRR